ncbi:MAG: hypothetical protein ABIH72_00530 [archaeon]
MTKKSFLLILAFLLASTFVLGADYHGSLNVDVGDGTIIIGPPQGETCTEDWSCSYWNSCTNNLQSFICVDCNACGTYDLRPATCGNTTSCDAGGTTVIGGGGGGGSGDDDDNDDGILLSSKACTELWSCGDWSTCQDGKEVRTCSDKNKCGTTSLKPVSERECEGLLTGNTEDQSGGSLLGAVLGLGGRIGNIGLSLLFIVVILAALIVLVLLRKKTG